MLPKFILFCIANGLVTAELELDYSAISEEDLLYNPKLVVSPYSEKIRGYEAFEGCSVSHCFISTNPNDSFRADAVLVDLEHTRNLDKNNRPQNQIWILVNKESPKNTRHLEELNDSINYTSTYSKFSDIPDPYGYYKPYPSPIDIESNFAAGKQGFVAWYVSNCVTSNNRYFYALYLKDYIPVDIFGSCTGRLINKKDAFPLLRTHYRFYLAFENSNCNEYISEKFWTTALMNNVIPVVMGPSRRDYERVAPKNSFIHVEDFNGPSALAKYLHEVAQNETLYNSYFEWKKYGYIKIESMFNCKLCALLHHPIKKIHSDLNLEFNATIHCPSIVYINKR